MAVGALLPIAAFVLILGGVGVRLVGLWRRTREVPEGALGGGLVIVSAAMPLTAVGRLPDFGLETMGRLCFGFGLVAVAIGISLIVFFTYWVFRRGSAWGGAIATTLGATLVGAACGMAWWNFLGESLEAIKLAMRPAAMTLLGATAASFVWTGVESFRYRRSVVRRLAIGLGDPVMANRFLLWGGANVISSLLIGVLAGFMANGVTILRDPLALAVMGVCGATMSACWVLTFFAPQRYLDYVRARATRSA